MTTHWIPPFTRDGQNGTKEAICGTFVTEHQHSLEPTCRDCANYLADEPRPQIEPVADKAVQQ